MSAPSNTDSVIDSRDIIARIEELQTERDEIECRMEDHAPLTLERESVKAELRTFDESDEGRELAILTALADECADYASDWEYGETLIRDTYFRTYAEELANDCGMLYQGVSSTWPYTCIDWERAAEELQQDYTTVDFDGVTYWIRSC